LSGRGLFTAVSIGAAAVACALPAGAPAQAAPAGTISWRGGDPENSSDVYAYSWGVSQTTAVGHGGGAPKPKLSSFTFTKPITPGSPRYIYDTARGKTLPAVQFSVPTGTVGKGTGVQGNVNYCMSNVQINSIGDSQKIDDTYPLQKVTLAYQDISVEFSASILNVVTIENNPKTGIKISFGHAHTVCPQPT
jgi:type VI protein secretion system component Hcp